MIQRGHKEALPYVATSIVLRPIHRLTHVLLAPRTDLDFQGKYFPPGGYVDIEETVAEAADRELREETGLRPQRRDYYPYPSDSYSMHLYKPKSDVPFAQIYPFHFVAWNKEMGVPANTHGNQRRWEWVPLETVYMSHGKDPRFPGNICSMMIHTLSVIRDDRTGWFRSRGITA